MKITRQDVEYVAALAHLELEPQELERMREQLDSILTYVDQLNQLNTASVEPMAQVLAETPPDAALRPDRTAPSLRREAALEAAPDADRTFFRVPKVIER
jgi:aspartyl-tRNA(Asn)/glutamyl-tRNA(Gln) amidotransferase subunit C